jgi:hypothetical protein
MATAEDVFRLSISTRMGRAMTDKTEVRPELIEQAERKLNLIRNEYLRTIPQSENDLRQTFLWWRDKAIALQAELESREPAAQPESPKCGACGRSGHWGDCGAAQGEWIAVTERLPEMFDSLADEGIYWSTSVLVADGPALDLAKYHTGKHGNKWIAESGSEMEVDYWMPLPAAPEEK